VLMPWFDQAAAVVEAWYPGQKGGEALARVLYGDVDAQGRLPVSFAQSDAQLPRPQLPGLGTQPVEGMNGKPGAAFEVDYPEGADVGYRWFQAKGLKATLPFGYGLSYTRFAYRGLKVEGGPELKVSFEVTNTGSRPGVDTPQVYATAPGRTRRLVGWRKVALKPGETKTVSVTADPRLLSRFDTAAHGFRLAAGDYGVEVGRFAGDAALSGRARLSAQSLKP
jgi:beta-glucosidase